jgi:SAM-dependent methyltransferase
MIERIPFPQSPEMQQENEVHREQAAAWTTEVIRATYPTREDFFRHYAGSAEGRQLLQVLETVPQGARVLDVGAGYGIIPIYLASLGYQVSAAEPSPDLCEYMERAANLYGVPLSIYHISAEYLDRLRAEPFDLCLFNGSLHHCDDPVHALTNCRDLLKTGGKLALMNEPLLQFFRSKRWFHRLHEHNALIAGDYGGNEHIYYYHEYRSMLARAGFATIADFPAFRYRDPASYLHVLEYEKAKPLSVLTRKLYYRTIGGLLRLGVCGKPAVFVLKRLSLLQTNFVATRPGKAA